MDSGANTGGEFADGGVGILWRLGLIGLKVLKKVQYCRANDDERYNMQGAGFG